ncbi:hypothetical protein [Bacillus sp. EAC]|uniref:hypothetical protein n=1 Tax=Bacillus sp. EAC TaxID=1978338 RepID=UPI000B4496AD|nr:hypothetical protein [Bacillus sp. EAC]
MRYLKLFLCMILLLTGCSYKTLNEAIQKKWKVPVKIQYIENKKQTVIFTDGTTDVQYVFSTFEKKHDRYIYSTDQEEGYTFDSDDGVPFLIRTINREKVGNIIWGALKTNKKVVRVNVVYTNKNNGDDQIEVQIPVKNNVFIGYPTRSFFDSETSLYQEWDLSAIAYDEDGKVVANINY